MFTMATDIGFVKNSKLSKVIYSYKFIKKYEPTTRKPEPHKYKR
jgi:hypothetical protein